MLRDQCSLADLLEGTLNMFSFRGGRRIVSRGRPQPKKTRYQNVPPRKKIGSLKKFPGY